MMIKRHADRKRNLKRAKELGVSPELMEVIKLSLSHRDQINYDSVYKEFLEADHEVQELLLDLGLVIRSA